MKQFNIGTPVQIYVTSTGLKFKGVITGRRQYGCYTIKSWEGNPAGYDLFHEDYITKISVREYMKLIGLGGPTA